MRSAHSRSPRAGIRGHPFSFNELLKPPVVPFPGTVLPPGFTGGLSHLTLGMEWSVLCVHLIGLQAAQSLAQCYFRACLFRSEVGI